MIKPHSRDDGAEVCWSLEECALAIGARVGGDGGRSGEIRNELEPDETNTSELMLVPAGIVSSLLSAPTIRTLSCLFERDAVKWVPSREHVMRSTEYGVRETRSVVPRSLLPAPRCTRIRPPRDLVKLEDRLRLLLQPPLETLLASRSLHFASPPFGYQLDGIAFLYPRHHAVLADEMGLGKTMQAVTAIRLLAHHGFVRRVLLVCGAKAATWSRS
jgi:hypothetical protein